MKYKDTDGLINYEEIGCGKPVIILHGLGCDELVSNWLMRTEKFSMPD